MAMPSAHGGGAALNRDWGVRSCIAAGAFRPCAGRCRLWASAPFRQPTSARSPCWTVGILRHQKIYPADVPIFPVASAPDRGFAQDAL